jgi:alkanesulfonate monooxygenase SsuD/methylene tetrahydromethanopterin reductase-like flavin-dependent oxidoreductase (luciferase family)
MSSQENPMQFGYVLAGQYLPQDDPQVRLREAVEQVRAAKQAGFTSIWATQHFLADFQFMQTMPFLARLSAEADGMAVGTGIVIATLYNPVLLAEEVATLDVLTGGRFVLGVGAGYRDKEFEAFGVPKGERLGRLGEMIDLQRKLWSGERVTHHGKYLHLDDAQMQMPPVQGEKLPIWIGAQGPKGIRQAAELGDEWLVSPELSMADIAEKQSVYLEALPEGVSAADRLFPALRETFAAKSHEDAVRIARAALETKYAAYASWGHQVGSFEDMAKASFVLGSVDDCVEQVEQYRSTLSTKFLGTRMQWPGLAQRDVLDSIAAFAEVIERTAS